ncbi:site-specific integrase [Prochlorococcus sp. MIT 1307]|uniref:site-specific integrase n=1 Tax=Prochlorococcus sp. MIT 1307 TaxID=3096219 RepID=UPI002A751F6C|nr:site-specific integrase [Prochlorococcus sp. MIT 1307]
MELNTELARINHDLASKGIKLRIERRETLLNIRGPLPCNTSKELVKNQRISLHLNADEDGLIEAQKMLQMVLFQLKHQQFKWEHWSKKRLAKKPTALKNAATEAVKSFKSAFFSEPSRKNSHAGSLTTWSSSYLPYLRRLVNIERKTNCNLNIELLNQTIETYSENSRSRQQCATALAALANHLDLDLPEDWRAKGNGYGLHKAHFRALPSDNSIKAAWLQIPNPKWRLVFGLMATYGLRNHEVFFSDLTGLSKDGDKVLRVLPNTKTGEHQVWPFHPSWCNEFGLEQLVNDPNSLPAINTDLTATTLQKVGRRVSEQFRRYNLPLTPYDLRHAWAVRTIHIGLPDTVAAKMMGHSVTIHNRTYHHWITRRDQQQAVDNALARINA